VNIFLDSGDDCTLDNLAACRSCTPSPDCFNPCHADWCDVCFGTGLLPERDCDTPECEFGTPCLDNDDCPPDYLCYLDCCYPPAGGGD
jgi:hypothetical protein